jgi:3-oxoacyl-[acyl-carrier-protein] synthase-3
MYTSRILGVGHYVPDNVVTNDDLSKIMDTSDEWIQERTGIKERRFVVKGEDTTSSMAIKASKKALEHAKIEADDIDLILFATLSPDLYFPGSGVLVQRELGMTRTVPAMDIRNQCSGFVYSLSTADQFIKTGMYKNILVIGSEYHSGGLDMTTRGRDVSVLFGDGAGAVILTRSEDDNRGILSSHLHSEGKYAEELCLLRPSTNQWVPHYIETKDADLDYFPYMNGKEVFRHAVTRFPEVIMEGLGANNLKPSDIDLFIPHQANLRISQFVAKKLQLGENQVFNNIQKYGNTTAATIPIALSEALEEGRVKEGGLLVLAAFGAGFTWGSVILRW